MMNKFKVGDYVTVSEEYLVAHAAEFFHENLEYLKFAVWVVKQSTYGYFVFFGKGEQVGLYYTFPESALNKFEYVDEDDLQAEYNRMC
jgi:hypothetical protein